MFALLEESRSAFSAHHRSPYLLVLLMAILAHLLLFALVPPFQFRPYQLEPEPPIIVQDVPDFEMPEAPKEIPLPGAIVPMDEEGFEDTVVPPTTFPTIGDFLRGEATSSTQVDEFVAFDELPVLIHHEPPRYPTLAREAGFEGTVHIQVVVGTDGKVVDATVALSDVTQAMEQAALAAARKCLFIPGKQRNMPVTVSVVVPFEFRLVD